MHSSDSASARVDPSKYCCASGHVSSTPCIQRAARTARRRHNRGQGQKGAPRWAAHPSRTATHEGKRFSRRKPSPQELSPFQRNGSSQGHGGLSVGGGGGACVGCPGGSHARQGLTTASLHSLPSLLLRVRADPPRLDAAAHTPLRSRLALAADASRASADAANPTPHSDRRGRRARTQGSKRKVGATAKGGQARRQRDADSRNSLPSATRNKNSRAKQNTATPHPHADAPTPWSDGRTDSRTPQRGAAAANAAVTHSSPAAAAVPPPPPGTSRTTRVGRAATRARPLTRPSAHTLPPALHSGNSRVHARASLPVADGMQSVLSQRSETSHPVAHATPAYTITTGSCSHIRPPTPYCEPAHVLWAPTRRPPPPPPPPRAHPRRAQPCRPTRHAPRGARVGPAGARSPPLFRRRPNAAPRPPRRH